MSNQPQSGRTRHEAEKHDGEKLRFLRTVPGHNAGDVAIVSGPRAAEYVKNADAELLEMVEQ